MRLCTLTAIAAILATIGAATPGLAQDRDHLRPPTPFAPSARPAPAFVPAAAPPTAPTAKDADDFIAKVEADLVPESEYTNRAQWIGGTYITDDTNWLVAKITAEQSMLSVARAKRAVAFDHIAVDPVTRRKLELLKQGLTLPVPDRPGASEEIANIQVKLQTIFSTGKVNYQGRKLTLEDVEEVLRTSRDPTELKALWEGWYAAGASAAA
jgi:peptidyl-dipeptidase A